ncbi:MAG: hypothetical protein JSW58_04365 [Candidatus Latescibacterota bacterium]|nr:MAG: hypothetical protein JSW58_04365 [Candidatus Latescibacterota bacterium]
MARALLLCALLLPVVAGVAFAQGGSISIFSDPGGSDCNLYDLGQGLYEVYIVHVNSTGTKGCQFAAPAPACLSCTYLSDIAGPYSVGIIGDSQTGAAAVYGECRASPIHVLTMVFHCPGGTAPCCYHKVVPHPCVSPPQVLAVDCSHPPELQVITGGEGIWNPDGSCQCDVPAGVSSWGKIKSLFVTE